MKAEKITTGIYLVGGPNISRSEDATVFVIDFGTEMVMIDSGAGRSARAILDNIKVCGLDPAAISSLILTHCHIDHVGGAPFFKKELGCRLIIHELDAQAVERGDPVLTAANWYETDFPPTPVDLKLNSKETVLTFGTDRLVCLQTPGHTPGSICVYLDRDGKRVLFGQDIHGPFLPSFLSNVELWKKSMAELLALEADILCEGHLGIFSSKERARDYITRQLKSH